VKPEDLPRQPLIRAALEKAGLSVDEVLADADWMRRRNPVMTSASRTDLPFILFDADGGKVDWGANGLELTFRRARGGYSFSMAMRRDRLPDAVMTGMVGRRLSEVIEVTGAESMTIALVKRNEDDTHYILGLIPDEEGKEEPDI
tara:strand:+ start:1703 stop:2137 length:435 start_codon:yes stop_codon:yes gene_type:complete